MSHWVNFRKDRFYLVRYLSIETLLTLLVLSFQWNNREADLLTDMTVHWWHFVLIPVTIILAIQIPVLIHNCVHRNLRPPVLNLVMGEIAGVFVLLGFAAFELNHVAHHTHSDTDLDPHNPKQKKFLPFFLANNFGGTKVILFQHLKYHGDTLFNRGLFHLSVFLHFINVPLRLCFWLFLLGPVSLVLLFLPAYAFHMFVFAHINYVTHKTYDDGKSEIFNLNHNLYYQFVNFFGSGVYYHKNHHKNPAAYNPKLGPRKSWLLR